MPWLQECLIILGGIAAAGIIIFTVIRGVSNNGEKIALEEFSSHADTFSGLYEPLYLMSKEEIRYRTGIIGDWAARTANLSSTPHYCEMWTRKLNGCTEWEQEQGLIRLKELMDFIKKAGICRDSSEKIIVDNNTYKRYGTLEDDLIEEGQPAQVRHPFWYLGEKILEKGTIENLTKE